MTYLILDTNIWIYLANGYSNSKNITDENVHFELIKILLDKLDLGEIELVTNDIIIKEWDRNKAAKETYIDKWENRIKANLNYFDSIKKYFDSDYRKRLFEIHEKFEKIIREKIAKSKFHIDQVEEILKTQSIILSVSDNVIKEVSELALNKRAPFHRNKNCIADAQILLSAIEYLKDRIDGLHNNAIFVTNNSDDFCISTKDNRLHPDLSSLFDSIGLRFETHLGSALQLSQKLSEELQTILNEISKNTIPCQSLFCKSQDEFIGSVVYLNQEYEFVRNDEVPFDPNQLTLEIGESNKPKPIEKRFLDSGKCVMCGVAHVVCPDCETIIDIEDIEEFSCPTCGVYFRQIIDGRQTIFKLYN